MKGKQVLNFALASLVSVFLFPGTRLFAQASLFDAANWQGAEARVRRTVLRTPENRSAYSQPHVRA